MTTNSTRASTDPHADAERRLGRPLTLAERNIDIIGLDRTLAAGKQRLHVAIEKEKRRAIRAHWNAKRPIRINVTEKMRAVIRGLYRTGQAHGRKEVKQLAGRAYAQSHHDAAKVAGLVEKLRLQLSDLERTVTDRVAEAETRLSIGEAAEIVIVQETMRLPGALDVASRMVSGSVFSGIGSVFEENAGLFTGWVRTAVMDNATCGPCEDGDGEEYDTWDEAMIDLPDGGPAVDCDGEGRCRCRLVPRV